jgi:hypothetical protein
VKKLLRRGSQPAAGPASPADRQDARLAHAPAPDPALEAERDRLTERFTVMQAELGGLFYEMAIRDHVRMEILMPKAAALQRVDAELAQVEHVLAGEGGGIGGHCPSCGAVHARGAAFCSQCAAALTG